MKNIAVLLVLLAVIGCVGISRAPVQLEPTIQPAMTIHVDVSFTDHERFMLQEAANIWRLQTDGLVDIKLVNDLDFDHLSPESGGWHTITKVDSLICDLIDCGTRTLGWTTTGGIHNVWNTPIRMGLVIDRLPDDNSFMQAAIHEFGHAAGCRHTEDENSIMYPGIIPGRKLCLRARDLSELCMVNNCSGRTLRSCEGR